MKKVYLHYFFFLVILFSCKSLAYKDYMDGVRLSENLNYSEGISSFLKSWEKSPEPEAARGLAQAYFKTRNFEQAEEWYARLQRDGALDTVDMKPFAEVLVANSKYAEAGEVLQKLDPEHSDSTLNFLRETAKNGRENLNRPTDAQVKAISEINTSSSEFGPNYAPTGELYFISDRLTPDTKHFNAQNALKSDVYGWTGKGFLKVYAGDWNEEEKQVDGALETPERFKSELHAGPVFQDGQNVFLTLTQAQKFEKSGSGSARDYTLFPEIYFARESDTLDLEAFQPLAFNNPFDYSVSDPYFHSASSRLYFSSDMPGGQGLADLYYVTWSQESGWSTPVNLGPEINTPGDERTPYVAKDGRLYFSSNGYAGIGGLDVMVATVAGDSFSNPENMGSPVNSNRDDFGFVHWDKKEEMAFLASDRTGGQGLDDLYWIDLNVKKELTLKGKVLDKSNNAVLEDAVVGLLSDKGEILESFVTEEDGEFAFKVQPDQILSLNGKKTTYLDGNVRGIQIPKAQDIQDTVITQNIYLERIAVGKTYRLENIYYDFDKWNIRDDAKPELDKLGKILMDNPTMIIELHSHTDSRGSDSYNQKLSNRRAQSAVDYLLSLGISTGRMKPIGYGETQLLNDCTNGSKCSEEAHQENRRTEFKIVSY